MYHPNTNRYLSVAGTTFPRWAEQYSVSHGLGAMYELSSDPLLSKKNMRPVSPACVAVSPGAGVSGGHDPLLNDSSSKWTISPSQENVEECQKSTTTPVSVGSPVVPVSSTVSSYTHSGFSVSGIPLGRTRHSWACSAQ